MQATARIPSVRAAASIGAPFDPAHVKNMFVDALEEDDSLYVGAVLAAWAGRWMNGSGPGSWRSRIGALCTRPSVRAYVSRPS